MDGPVAAVVAKQAVAVAAGATPRDASFALATELRDEIARRAANLCRGTTIDPDDCASEAWIVAVTRFDTIPWDTGVTVDRLVAYTLRHITFAVADAKRGLDPDDARARGAHLRAKTAERVEAAQQRLGRTLSRAEVLVEALAVRDRTAALRTRTDAWVGATVYRSSNTQALGDDSDDPGATFDAVALRRRVEAALAVTETSRAASRVEYQEVLRRLPPDVRRRAQDWVESGTGACPRRVVTAVRQALADDTTVEADR
jgi:hypothetical protein